MPDCTTSGAGSHPGPRPDDPARHEAEPTHCAICGERFTASDEIAEMYDPDGSEELVGLGKADGVVHAQCGLWRGWSVS